MKSFRSIRFGARILAATLLLVVASLVFEVQRPAIVEAQTLLAQVQLGRERVFVGERFSVRVRVVGNVQPDVPDVSGVRDFEVEYLDRKYFAAHRETSFATCSGLDMTACWRSHLSLSPGPVARRKLRRRRSRFGFLRIRGHSGSLLSRSRIRVLLASRSS